MLSGVMEPYVIRQGDTLATLAYRFGFDADVVWNDPKNDDLRKRRSDPNILKPTDILYIPERASAPSFTLVTGTMNSFVSYEPTVPIHVHFVDRRLASQPLTVGELEDLTGLSTDSSGWAKFDAPVTLRTATVTFPEVPFTCTLRVGQLDPINTLSGSYQRLRNLGYIDATYDDTCSLDVVRSALAALKQDLAAPSSAAPEGPDDDGATPTNANNGMNDDGTMDDETSKLLLETHGC
ncbi:MAG: LysM peptidoglycan-binding domain-containing protein [Polyangiaceae bacterium]|jgi:hypothetical protein